KYPKIFLTSQIFLISKIDLLPYFDFKIEKIKKEALELNPKLQIIEISAKTGENIDKWIKILEEKRKEILCTNSQL
ncbi:hydrogenase accessory protein HypB, partial [Candidatus Pacearchaeota archaeon]